MANDRFNMINVQKNSTYKVPTYKASNRSAFGSHNQGEQINLVDEVNKILDQRHTNLRNLSNVILPWNVAVGIVKGTNSHVLDDISAWAAWHVVHKKDSRYRYHYNFIDDYITSSSTFIVFAKRLKWALNIIQLVQGQINKVYYSMID